MKSPSSNKADNCGARGERGGVAISAAPPIRRARRGSHASKDRSWMFDPESAIERETEAIVPLWTAEHVVTEAGRWLDVPLPAELPAFLAAKAEHCFARHRQFHRLVCSKANGGHAGLENLRKFMRHWTCSWLKRTRLALYRRLPESYGLGVALPRP